MTHPTRSTHVPRYIVIGAGAVGGALAAGLHEAGVPVVLVARGAALDAIRSRGLVHRRPDGPHVVPLAVAAGPEEVSLTGDDVLVVATKSQDAAGVLTQWAWQPVALGAGSRTVPAELPVVTLQNGLDAEREALRRFRVVVGGTVLVAGRHVVPGEVSTAAAPRTGQLLLGPVPASGADAARGRAVAERLARDADAAGWLTQVVPDIERWKAWKLVVNATNALEVLTGDDAGLTRVREGVVAEARAVLAAAGRDLAEPDRERSYDASLARITPGGDHVPGQQSTWQSFARGASSEVDHLNGEVVLLGRLHGVPTPFNAALQRVLGAAALAAEPPGVRDVAEVLALAGDQAAPVTEPTGAAVR